MSEIQFSGLPGDKVQNPAPAIDPKTGIPFADHKPDDSPKHLAEFKMESIDDLINNFNGQYNKAHEKVEKLEEDFKDTKLNPYGVTQIDFSKRQELKEHMSRLEGAINGLKIAKETFFLDDVKVRNPGQKYEELT
jgi:hypothetical protein|tara:strand:+ start:15210 stop:15614 length:405 start_codon:yes stop_codon:yes gene_type:complete